LTKSKTPANLTSNEEEEIGAKVLGERGWERYNFDKYVPVDNTLDDEIPLDETEAAILSVRKRKNPSFSYSLDIERSDAEIAHEEAIFGRFAGVSAPPIVNSNSNTSKHTDKKRDNLQEDKEKEPPKFQEDYKKAEKESEDGNNIVNKKLVVHQRNMQNEWLRRVEEMRAKKAGATELVTQESTPTPPISQPMPKEKRAPISFQLAK